MKKEKQLVEAFKVFMEKGVIPFLQQGHVILNQWKFLSGILTLEPIDLNQIDFYLLMANKNNQRSPSIKVEVPLPPKQHQPKNQMRIETINNNSSKQYRGSTKKILGSMQSFQGLMIKNQQKLQSLAKKDMPSSKADVNTSIQGNKKNS